ncbi:GmrSD restriction endonuclease domain-containing protein [Paraburkholderia dilworthii]|uniref:GmrSD restriction endonuclease domain-containing protein n=1 Tax=Paraburkholderia dilworthii TaxID=948106 RepID=UPI00041A4039|nr:DUF1524 domain-containing protein [Paraburkholderia dilworthii]
MRYFLYEYEQHLLHRSRQQKVDWGDLLKSQGDLISIEHLYPQTPTPDWEATFKDVPEKQRERYAGSLGNLLLLSMTINALLQNDAFSKKKPKFDGSGTKARNGYSDGSHSEIEVAADNDWGPEQIRNRGHRLLKFMESRWDILLKDEDREKLLFLSREEHEEMASA